ncbi:MAG: phosphomannomutase/phosphoglucomutase, partial [Solirubrobacterales bacterium]
MAITAPPASIFKAYDIRGIYGEELDAETAHLIGRSFARVLARLRGKDPADLRVGLGRDMRLSAPEMAAAVRAGLVEEGVTVLDAGQIATEMSYYLVGSRELDGGAMVTASHNPKRYTGVKLMREGALALSGDAGIQDVRAEIEAGLPDPPGGGSAEEIDIYPDFHEHMLSIVDPDTIGPLRILADGSDGMAGPMVGPLLEKLNLEVTTSRWEPNGDFPEAGPNPFLEENRRMLVERVTKGGFDLAIAWDGDADRCFFIDGEGNF